MAELSPPAELEAGKYRLTRLLGRGGMGSVWEGVHVTLGTHVAVKYIDADYVQNAGARSRFDNEAKAAARLQSKHVVKVYDHGVSEDGRPFIVMEHLSGESLEQRLARVGRLSLAETATIIVQVCRALTKAHEIGIVHRDLKPENVFLVRDEEDGTEIVKVVDFGIAKFIDTGSGIPSATRTGALVGTPHYMSPEQARGLRSIDHRSDLWSVAVLAYRCVTGALPFTGEAVGDVLVQVCTAPPPAASALVPALSSAFDAWLARAFAREPEQRFQSALELAEALAAVAGLRAPASAPSASMFAATVAADGSDNFPRPPEGVTGAPFTTSQTLASTRTRRAAVIGGVVAAAVVVAVVVGASLAVRDNALAPENVSSAGAASAPPVAPSAEPAPPPPTVAAVVEAPASAAPQPTASTASAAPTPTGAGAGIKVVRRKGSATNTTKSGSAETGGTSKSGSRDVGY